LLNISFGFLGQMKKNGMSKNSTPHTADHLKPWFSPFQPEFNVNQLALKPQKNHLCC
jgi:hypothetical protein